MTDNTLFAGLSVCVQRYWPSTAPDRIAHVGLPTGLVCCEASVRPPFTVAAAAAAAANDEDGKMFVLCLLAVRRSMHAVCEIILFACHSYAYYAALRRPQKLSSSSYLRIPSWIELHQTKSKMSLGLFFTCHQNTFYQRKCEVVTYCIKTFSPKWLSDVQDPEHVSCIL